MCLFRFLLLACPAAGRALDLHRRAADLKQARLLAAMRAAEAKDIEDGCQLIILPNDADGNPVFWPGMDSNTLFVRPMFKTFFETLLNCLDLKVGDAHFRTLLRGVPGIGKSSFGL
jgi:hypothetical protein